MNNHRDREIRQLITALTDALCQYERNTGSENILIIRDDRGFQWRAINGKPDVPEDLEDAFLLRRFSLEPTNDTGG